MNTPLSKSKILSHYIRPVYPFYVTEYEDKFRWPSCWKKPEITAKSATQRPQEKAPPKVTQIVPEGSWDMLKTAAEDIVHNGDFPETLPDMEKLVNTIDERTLSADIDTAYLILKKEYSKMNSDTVTTSDDDTKNGNGSEALEELDSDREKKLHAYHQFIRAVDKIKNC
jgi:hypothetical protein